jgi:hypothetical protein
MSWAEQEQEQENQRRKAEDEERRRADELIRVHKGRIKEGMQQNAAQEIQSTLNEIKGMKQAPVRVKAKLTDDGIRSLGGELSIPLSERIGFRVGGAYAPGGSQSEEYMGAPMSVRGAGSGSAYINYSSPSVEAELTYTSGKRSASPGTDLGGLGINPNGGFSGAARVRGSW